MDPNIELNHLKYFYFTVLEGGVAPAANRLHVQQPVVSKMLKRLEEQLDKPLFWKKGRTKSLTDYGQLVFRHCQVVFDEVDRIKQLGKDNSKLSGVCNIGGAEPIVNSLFEPTLKPLLKEFPNINFNVYTSTQTHLLNLISGGNLDLGCFFYASSLPDDLEIIHKISLPFRLVIKKELLKKNEIIESFIGSREIDDTSTHSFPTIEFIRKKHPKTRITFSSNSITLHKQLVMGGKGVSIMPEFMVTEEIKRGVLADLFPRKKFQWELLIVKRKSNHLSIPTKAFVDSWN